MYYRKNWQNESLQLEKPLLDPIDAPILYVPSHLQYSKN